MQGKYKAFSAVVSGRVQGVGFRYSAQRFAQRMGIKGWVRNDIDGTVTVHCEGPEEKVMKYVAWLRKGPAGAIVRDFRVREVEYQGIYPAFTIEF